MLNAVFRLKIVLMFVGMSCLAYQSNQPTPNTTNKATQISASPTSLVLLPGETGTTTISWTGIVSSSSVYVSVNGAPATLFARGLSGSQEAPWIVAGRTYVFTLYASYLPIFPAGSVTVTGVPVTGNVSASPTTLVVPAGQTRTTTLSWMTNGSNSQIFVSVNGAPETEFATGRTGSQQAPWIQGNRTYTFRQYAGTTQTHLLDTVVVRGVQAGGSLSASPTAVRVAPGATAPTTLFWSLQNISSGQIRYRINQGSEVFLRNVSGSSGTVVFSGVREGRSYEFHLYPTGSSTALDSASVTGISSYGFVDNGLVSARARTEFRNADIPNLTPRPDACRYPDSSGTPVINPNVCNVITSQTVYPAANEWQQNSGFNTPNYWVIGMNTESDPWLTCNQGPPNMSEPNMGIDFKNGSIHKDGRYGFNMRRDPTEGFWRAHLAVNNKPLAPQSACSGTDFSFPFLSVASHQGYGNPTPVGVLNPSGAGPSTTQFTARMWDHDPNSTVTDFHVYAMTRWGGERRGMFIRIVREGSSNGPYAQVTDRVWNWPLQESHYFGGANWVYFDADNVKDFCPNIIQEIPRMLPCSGGAVSPDEVCGIGNDVTYTIDWQALFECADAQSLFNDPMPTNQFDIPIDGIGWAVEAFGESGTNNGGALWMSIHNMRMLPSP